MTFFEKKYPQKAINEDDKKKIVKFYKRYFLKGNSPKEFYESFQILFFYLNDSKNKINIDNDLKALLDIIPPELNLSEDFNNFLNEEGKEFQLDKILEIYLYFEHLFFVKFLEQIDQNFTSGINDSEKIKKKFENFEIKEEFVKALRRYITRNLLENKDNVDNLKEENLIKEFFKSDLWGINEMKNFDKIKEILSQKLRDIEIKNIKVSQAFFLYTLLGMKDTEEVKCINNEQNLNKIDDDIDDTLANKKEDDIDDF